MIQGQEKKNYNNTFYKKVQYLANALKTEIGKVTCKKKLTWKKRREAESGKKEDE